MSLLALAALLVSTSETPATPPEDKIVCKRDRNTDTGSNLRKRNKICMRASDWKILEKENEQTAREMFQTARGSPKPVGSTAGAGGGE